ncbi:hypothetical protein PNEG_01752 [Pneumocystis murina B123]|uniref:1-phosphatidylinositol 4-kinase n=1 Tax=Pneumocystis murina (strain B123) TaxID=1069680 RepID=M7PHQ8_PNEMU|nr:hypothetical protein PNEG_01752 [Pneumocystis murina B123]EMR09994.1 hypothetical protein PNEG_01752 [Pneumocystis murina B123]
MNGPKASGNDLLFRFFESTHFTSHLCVAYLARYPDNIGIHHYLCSKLKEFSATEIEFFLPQLCHLAVNLNTESVALEIFILDQCKSSSHIALMVFWLFQAHFTDLLKTPEYVSFRTCKRMFNKIQHIIFGEREIYDLNDFKVRENIFPSILLSSVIIGSASVPFLSKTVGPIAIAQARQYRPQSRETDKGMFQHTMFSDFFQTPRENVSESLSNSISMVQLDRNLSQDKQNLHEYSQFSNATSQETLLLSLYLYSKKSLLSDFYAQNYEILSSVSPRKQSLLLQTQYFRYETAFLQALQDISSRLIIVPELARLSALRAELTLLNSYLPADICIPSLCTATASYPIHHRIVRINSTEAIVLNSAKRVPYLLIIEILENDLSFDPEKMENKEKIAKILSNTGKSKRLFDLLHDPILSHNFDAELHKVNQKTDIESDLGDISVLSIYDYADDMLYKKTDLNGHSDTSLPEFSKLKHINHSFDPRLKFPQYQTETNMLSKENNSLSPFIDENSIIATYMRAAATMLAQLDSDGNKRPKVETSAIKSKIIKEMQNLEEKRINMNNCENFIDARMNNIKYNRIEEKNRNSTMKIFEEEWSVKVERIRKSSPYSHLPNWNIISVIVKTGSDLRQEAFACQLIYACQKIWDEYNIPVWVKRMRILITGNDSGLIETIINSTSIHSIKKKIIQSFSESSKGKVLSLKDYFLKMYGDTHSVQYKAAQDCFMRSLAAYSLICYIFQLKDRHNGNILLDTEGHLIHIDFGFMLTNTPGNVGFENAPFKLTTDYVNILDDRFDDWKDLMKQAFKALRKKAEDLILLVKIMQNESKLPCFSSGELTSIQFQQRFQLHLSETEADEFMESLITKANASLWTRLYDQYQQLTQGIY